MKKMFSLLILTMLFVGNAIAMPDIRDVVVRLNNGAVRDGTLRLGTVIGTNKIQTIKCKYDFAVQGGAISTISLKDEDGATCSIPPKALILSGMVDVITAPLSGGSATVAVGSGAATNDLVTATAKASFTGRLDVVPVNTAATAIKVGASAITPSMTVATAALTAGKFNVYISYVLGD